MTTIIEVDGVKYRFVCKKCEHGVLEEVATKAVVTSQFNVIDEGDAEYGEINIQDCEVSSYQCENCGAVIMNENKETVDQYDDLVEFFRTNKDWSKKIIQL
jgi:transposase-like protein